MNTPLLITSAVLLVSVAARPVDNARQGDDLRELAHRPNSDGRQAFLGRVPALEALNSFQLHDLHDTANSESGTQLANKSPKLAGTELSQPDPGLASPYVGPQRQLAIDQELGITPLSPDSRPSSPTPVLKTHQQPIVSETPDYSPLVVTLVLSSLAALVLLGLTISIVYVATVFRQSVLNKDVWRSISRRQDKETRDVSFSEKAAITRPISKQINQGTEEKDVVIAAHEMPFSAPIPPPILSEKATDEEKDVVDDPDLTPLPETPAPIMHEPKHGRSLTRAFAEWSYDNWVAHFMMALFGWVGLLFGGARSR
ncbi:hypothetical protein BU17DRAFT_68671 [Hysterangium stoloniferum]|nr:hypothetical protein BU17DRAFT_68671 [Hysterangium stoloniferum]